MYCCRFAARGSSRVDFVLSSLRFLTFLFFFFFFNATSTTEIYTLSLHDALPISISFKEQIQLYSVYGTDWLYGNHGGLGRYGDPTFTPSMSSRGSCSPVSGSKRHVKYVYA